MSFHSFADFDLCCWHSGQTRIDISRMYLTLVTSINKIIVRCEYRLFRAYARYIIHSCVGDVHWSISNPEASTVSASSSSTSSPFTL